MSHSSSTPFAFVQVSLRLRSWLSVSFEQPGSDEALSTSGPGCGRLRARLRLRSWLSVSAEQLGSESEALSTSVPGCGRLRTRPGAVLAGDPKIRSAFYHNSLVHYPSTTLTSAAARKSSMTAPFKRTRQPSIASETRVKTANLNHFFFPSAQHGNIYFTG